MDECNQEIHLKHNLVFTHLVRFEHLIEHVGSLMGRAGEVEKRESFWTCKPFISRDVQFRSFPTTNMHDIGCTFEHEWMNDNGSTLCFAFETNIHSFSTLLVFGLVYKSMCMEINYEQLVPSKDLPS